jgi:hypothetical protein
MDVRLPAVTPFTREELEISHDQHLQNPNKSPHLKQFL